MIQQARDLLEQPPGAQKERWNKHMEKYTELCEIQREDSERLAKLYLQEVFGGKCTKCGTEYKQILVDNIFCKGTFYQPACDCFWPCPRCENNHYLETIDQSKWHLHDYTGARVCARCNWEMEMNGQKNYGYAVRQAYLKLEQIRIDAATNSILLSGLHNDYVKAAMRIHGWEESEKKREAEKKKEWKK